MASTVLGGLAIVLVGALRDWRVSLSEILVVTAGAQIIGALFLFPIKLEQAE
jgi:hypothetical protein